MAPTNYIRVNNDENIVFVKGTYSNGIMMSPDDEGRFTNDIAVSVEHSGFTFFPAENVLRLGDTSYEFKVGIDKDMMAGTYLL